MSVNIKSIQGDIIPCPHCGGITFKESKKNVYKCSYCLCSYPLDKKILQQVKIVKHTMGRYPYKEL